MDAERLLIERTRAGDPEAFAGLVKAYQGPVYNLAYRMLGTAAEAEEAAQETFLRVYQRLHTYDAECKFSSWVLSIASHYCIDRLRRRRIAWLPLDGQPAVEAAETVLETPEPGFLERERQEEIQALLARLPEGYRLVLVLRYWQDLSYEEIGQMLGCTESAVKSRLHRAREMLAGHLARRQAEQVKTRMERRMAGHAVP